MRVQNERLGVIGSITTARCGCDVVESGADAADGADADAADGAAAESAAGECSSADAASSEGADAGGFSLLMCSR